MENGGFDPQYGARPMRRTIQKLLEDPLAEALLRHTFIAGDKVKTVVEDGQLVFKRTNRRSKRAPLPVVQQPIPIPIPMSIQMPSPEAQVATNDQKPATVSDGSGSVIKCTFVVSITVAFADVEVAKHTVKNATTRFGVVIADQRVNKVAEPPKPAESDKTSSSSSELHECKWLLKATLESIHAIRNLLPSAFEIVCPKFTLPKQ